MKFFIIPLLLFSGLICRTSGSMPRHDIQRLLLNPNHPIELLKDGWSFNSDAGESGLKISIPFNSDREFNTCQFSYSFKCPPSYSDHGLRIWFFGLYGYAEIYLNSTQIFEHPFSTNRFYVDIPNQYIERNNENLLKITLSKPKFRHEKVPNMPLLFRGKDYFGKCDEIALEWLPPIDLLLTRYKYAQDSLYYGYSFTLSNILPKNVKQNELIKIEEVLFSPTDDKIFTRFQYVKPDKKEYSINRSIKIGDQLLWSPENPQRIQIKLRATSSIGVISEVNYQLGLRAFEVRGDKFFLNDKQLKLKGITYRQPVIQNFKRQIDEDIAEIKKLGFNAIRCPYYIPHPYLISAADSLGIMLLTELGICRAPDIYYKDNLFIQSIKSLVNEIVKQYQHDPSIVALALAHEISLSTPETNKFIFIINEQLKSHPTILGYISPLNPNQLPRQAITDFYMINKYGEALISFLERIHYQPESLSEIPLLIGNVGLTGDIPEKQNDYLNSFFSQYDSDGQFDGYFIESYRDWEAPFWDPFTKIFHGKPVYPYGMITEDNTKRPFFQNIPLYLRGNHHNTVRIETTDRKSNFFSILAFISSIIFFLIYKRSFRFRENLSRSLVHPYGFFVDLRDRRIISTLNSTILGLFASLQMANFAGAFFYYYHNNLWVQEYLLTLTRIFKLNPSYLEMIQTPWSIVTALLILFYSAHLIVAFILKLFAFFLREHVRFKQGLAVSNWSGSPAVFFIPISMFGYYLFQQQILSVILWPVFLLFFIWYNFRLANGIRVLFMFRPLKIIIIMILTYSTIMISLFVYADMPVEMYEYLKLLGKASGLFY